ncbi:MAG: hypothetical protein SF052_00205 [Bacteroidia bacterium]|nr:hypothetical protein [Bacteroidia bacterium]
MKRSIFALFLLSLMACTEDRLALPPTPPPAGENDFSGNAD